MPIPKGYDWQSLLPLSGIELETHYNTMLRELAQHKGILGQIYAYWI